MSNEKNGGNAFPELNSNTTHEWMLSEVWSSEGMTLLDYFAAKAMPEMIRVNNGDYKNAAKESYEQAAAMIEERKKYI